MQGFLHDPIVGISIENSSLFYLDAFHHMERLRSARTRVHHADLWTLRTLGRAALR